MKIVNLGKKETSTDTELNADTSLWLEQLGITKPNNLVDTDYKLYSCDRCKDEGWVFKNVQHHDYIAREAVKCDCFQIIQTAKNIRNSGMDYLFAKTIKDFRAEQEFQIDMKKLATKYVNTGSDKWFVLLGQSGSGKTHLCSAVAKSLIDNGLPALYVTWDDFVEEVNTKMYYDGDRQAKVKFKDIEVLYIDDLFKGKPTDNDLKIAFQILNARSVNNKTTIISSELSLEEIRELDQALAGRIAMSAGEYLYHVPTMIQHDFRMKGVNLK